MKIFEINLKGICEIVRKVNPFLLVFFDLEIMPVVSFMTIGVRNDIRFKIMGEM